MMTPDVARLKCVLSGLSEVLDQFEFEFVDDPNCHEPSDTSYLSDSDRADPDIMANIEAMEATNKRTAWFGRDQEGFVGLWHGPGSFPLEQAPVVRLDSEGQYSLVAATIPNNVAMSVDEATFDEARAALLAAGFEVAASREEIWDALDGLADPNAFRHNLYNQGRVRRGLKPIQ